MPNSLDEWMWWTFSVVVVGSLLSIAANLASNPLQRFLDKYSERRREKRLENNRSNTEYIQLMVKQAETDSTVLTAMAYLENYHFQRGAGMTQAGYTWLIVGVIIFLTQIDYDPLYFFIEKGIGVIVIIGALFLILTGRKTKESSEIYGEVIFTYHERHHIRKQVSGN